MKKITTIAVALLLLASCGGGYNPPSNPNYNPNTPSGGNTNNNGGPKDQSPVAKFEYSKSHPLYVHFTNTSQNATKYEWNFGDGKTSTEKSPTHQYEEKGVYKVTLKVKNTSTSKQDTYTQNITVLEPTTCYITSVEYQIVPKNNEYYSIRCTDDYVLFETLYWYTDWVLLSSANLPYTYTLKTKQKIDFGLSEFVIRLYQNSSNSGSGKQVEAWSGKTSGIKKYYHEELNCYNDYLTSKISLKLEWDD